MKLYNLSKTEIRLLETHCWQYGLTEHDSALVAMWPRR